MIGDKKPDEPALLTAKEFIYYPNRTSRLKKAGKNMTVKDRCCGREIETKCIHLEEAEGKYENYGAVSFPIYQSATFAHEYVGAEDGYDYSRLQNPTRERLEKIIASLENGCDAVALSSGMAAISLLMEIFEPGDNIIIDSDLYGGSIRLFDSVSAKNKLSFTRVNCCRDNVEECIKENTKALFLETPTNPMMNVCDIEKLSLVCKKHGIIFIVDNTFLSPYLQNPLMLGADIVIHSGSKYIGGHNDTLSGFIVTNRKDLSEKFRFLIKTIGSSLAPFDCWLVLRGVQTLPIRMEKAQENAAALALWLKSQSVVTEVIYPGLPEHPGYEIMKRQARGFGAMITFKVKNEAAARHILENVRLIKFAESLGGTESLITYPVTQTHADVPEEVRLANGLTKETLRLSVGIENIKDLKAELEKVFALS